MVKIKVDELNEKIKKIEQIIDNYEENVGNINLCYQNISLMYKGGVFDTKIKEIEEEMLNNKKMVNLLKEQCKVYKNLYDFYKELGSSVNCNLDSKDFILDKIDINISNIEDIKVKLSNTNNYLNTTKELSKINNILTAINKVKTNINDAYNKIEDKEYEIYNKVSENIVE